MLSSSALKPSCRPKAKPTAIQGYPSTSQSIASNSALNEWYHNVDSIPPRVLNSFFLWKKHYTNLMTKGEVPTLSSSKEWSLAWRALAQTERNCWQERFREDNAAFLAANPGYSYGAVKGLKKKAREERQRRKRLEKPLYRGGSMGRGMVGVNQASAQGHTRMISCFQMRQKATPGFKHGTDEGARAVRRKFPPLFTINGPQTTHLRSLIEQTRDLRGRFSTSVDEPPKRMEPRLVRNTSLLDPIQPCGPGLRATANGDDLWFTKSPVVLSPLNSLAGSQWPLSREPSFSECISPLTALFQEKCGDCF